MESCAVSRNSRIYSGIGEVFVFAFSLMYSLEISFFDIVVLVSFRVPKVPAWVFGAYFVYVVVDVSIAESLVSGLLCDAVVSDDLSS